MANSIGVSLLLKVSQRLLQVIDSRLGHGNIHDRGWSFSPRSRRRVSFRVSVEVEVGSLGLCDYLLSNQFSILMNCLQFASASVCFQIPSALVSFYHQNIAIWIINHDYQIFIFCRYRCFAAFCIKISHFRKYLIQFGLATIIKYLKEIFALQHFA